MASTVQPYAYKRSANCVKSLRWRASGGLKEEAAPNGCRRSSPRAGGEARELPAGHTFHIPEQGYVSPAQYGNRRLVSLGLFMLL